MRFILLGVLSLVAAGLSGCTSTRVSKHSSQGILQVDAASVSGNTARHGEIVRPLPPNAAVDSEFVWPLHQGQVSSFYGNRRRDYHEGIDIRANRGTPIYAARSGRVIYSSRRIGGYGNMIVIKHDGGMATIYAHNKKNVVKRGDQVFKGQLVGYVGATGKATGPHLHFEIRRNELPQDPLLYLPQARGAAVARQ